MTLTRGMWKPTFDSSGKVTFEKVEKTSKIVEAPAVQTDEIPGGLESMVTGKIHTSKSSLRREYKEHGVIEVGDSTGDRRYVSKKDYQDKDYDNRLKKGCEEIYYQCRDNMFPLSELDKARCKIMDENREKYCYDRRGSERE